jgi:hypothetical protein
MAVPGRTEGFCMKKSRLSERQIAFILRPVEKGTTAEEASRKAAISEPAC